MRIKHPAAAALLALALTGSVLAQGQNRPATTVYPTAILNRLNLNADQTEKAKAAGTKMQAEAAKAQPLKGKEKRQAMTTAFTAYEAEVNAVLSPEQQKQLQDMLAEARQYPAGIGPRLIGLNLTDEQKGKVKEIAAKYQPEILKLRTSLKDSADKQGVQAQIREQNTKMAQDVRGILTPDQQKLFDESGARRKKNQ